MTLDLAGGNDPPVELGHPADDGSLLVRVGGGTSLDGLMRWAVPRGWFVPVTPGTRYVTVGGAVAADIHGKNHHRDGSFGAHVERMTVDTPAFGVVETLPGEDLFRATVGGMGLTGVVRDVDVRLPPISTSVMLVTTERAPTLDDVLTTVAERDQQYHYTVAWLDVLAGGSRFGRGVIMSGDHAEPADLSARTSRDPLAFDPSFGVEVPDLLPVGVVQTPTVTAFNTLWYLKTPRSRTQTTSIASFFHPLDAVRSWNRLYGPGGFVQYQIVLPDEETDTLHRVLERLGAARAPSPLTVLKRFGAEGAGLLSFPRPGWTLAVDLPAHGRFAPRLDELDRLVVEAGGRAYLAKDARMRRGWLSAMYPRLDQWRTVRDRYDPNGLIVSDLDRRLNVSGRWP